MPLTLLTNNRLSSPTMHGDEQRWVDNAIETKRYLLSFAIYGALVYAASLINIEITHYMSWILYTGITFAATGVVTLLVNLLVMRKETVSVVKTFIRRLPKKWADS